MMLRGYRVSERLVVVCLLVIFSQSAQAQDNFLDVSIDIFTSAPPVARTGDDTTNSSVDRGTDTETFNEVRLAEVRYLPMYLRYQLEASQQFGAVRVVPALDNGAQLMVEGQIIRSNGAVLELAIKAHDSTGRVWIENVFSAAAVSTVALSGDPLAQDDFAHLFADIVRELVGVLQQLAPAQIAEIQTVALLRYGQGLAPQAFADYLQLTSDGTMNVVRLPAVDDPLLMRIREIREHEYLFIDVVDQEYQQFFGNIKPVYDMWRQFQREQADTADNFTARETASTSQFRRGSYYALQESYNNYRWAKVQELYQDELTTGFANEVEPTEIALENSLYKLNGTLEQQYREWRTILAEMFALEMGE